MFGAGGAELNTEFSDSKHLKSADCCSERRAIR